MKIHTPHVDIVYEAQEGCDTIRVKVDGLDPMFFPAYQGGLRMVTIDLPLECVGKDLSIVVDADGILDIGKIVSRKAWNNYCGIAHTQAKEEAIKQANSLPVTVQWFTTWKCNYQCEYCWQETCADTYRKDRPGEQGPDEWARAILRLDPDAVYITGGEPSVKPHMAEIAGKIGRQVPFEMTSNLGRSFRVKEWAEKVRPEWVDCFTFSFHPTQVEWEEYRRKIEEMVEAFGPSKVGVELVMHPRNAAFEPKVRSLVAELGLRTYNLDGYAYQPQMYPKPVKAKECPKPANIIHDVLMKRESPWDTVYCPAGMRRINVDPVGDAYTCMSAIDRGKMFGPETAPHYPKMGNIFDRGFKMRDEPVLCWESWRCSHCDSSKLDQAWVKHPNKYRMPLPE